ncbi:MAG: TRAP transporter small permease [Rubrivivax sp.]|nr:TRAP transporter small permease [Rubrivivax sp.]
MSFTRVHAALMRGCGVVAAATVAAITLLVCYDVVGRNLGLKSLVWVNEVTEYALPIATLAAAPWLMWRNQHVRLDVLGALLSPRAQRHVDRFASALALVVSLLLVWYSVKVLLDSKGAGSLVIKALVFPEWWVYVPVPIGFALLALECGRRVIRPSGLTDESSVAR